MKKTLLNFLIPVLLIIGKNGFSQIYSENFNDPSSLGVSYTLEDALGTTFNFFRNPSINTDDYITNDFLTNLVPVGDGIEIQPNNHDGSRAIALEDMDGVGFPSAGMFIVTRSIDISSFSDLSIGLKVASTSSNVTRYEEDDGIDIDYQINGVGAWITVGRFRGVRPTGIPYLHEDTDLDGIFETQTGPNFRTVSYSLDARAGATVTGSTIRIRIFMHSEGSQEEISFDDLILTGTAIPDVTAPSVTITTTETDPTNNSPFSISITFSEEVTGFSIGDISVGNGVASDLTTTDNITFTANITPATDGPVTVNIGANSATDLSGNGNDAALQFSIVYNSPPVLSIEENTPLSDVFSFMNPVGETLVLTTSLKIKSIQLYNLSGAIVARSLGKNLIDTSNLVSGIYMAYIITENGLSTTAKVLKK